MYRHTDIYRPIWRCCRCIVSAKFRRYISAIFSHKSVALLLCMERSETQVATSSLTLIDHHNCSDLFLAHIEPAPHAYRRLCNSTDKTLYDVTFAHTFWRCKQTIACEQTRLLTCFCVGWLFYQGLSRLDSLAFMVHKKVPTSQRAGPRFTQNSMWFFIAVKWWF